MDKSIITYSRSITINLSRICTNQCLYCDYPDNKLDQTQYELVVPYSTIKLCSQAKKNGVKEVHFVSGERPDNFAAVRARLDLWGFQSFIEYAYTVCELVFLEGLIPSIEIGHITQNEMNIIRRMTSSVTMMLDTADEKIIQKYSPNKTLQSRIDVIKYAGVGKVPVTTGLMVGMGESQKSRKEALEIIKNLHQEYGHIQNVVIKEFTPPEKYLEVKSGPTQKEVLETIAAAKEILPADIAVTISGSSHYQNIIPFIKAGAKDLGNFDIVDEKIQGLDHTKMLNSIERQLKKEGLGIQRRLPIFSKYIAENWYSRKLAQVLDRYKALLQNSETKESAAEEKTPKTKKTAKKTTVKKKKK